MSKDRVVAKLKMYASLTDAGKSISPEQHDEEQRYIDRYVTRKKRRARKDLERRHSKALKTKAWLPIHLKDVSYEQSELKEAKENLSKVLSEADDFARENT
jgi:hypothetical protein